MIVYHRTNNEAAEDILVNGFRDATGTYLTVHEYSGVWVSRPLLDINEGAVGDQVFAIEIDESLIADYEWG